MLLKQHVLPALTALLSSSCCVIQLVLNFFSISCAGFAIFTPYRNALSCLTLLLLTYNVYKKGLKNRSVLFSIIICISLMISPSIVQIINTSNSSTTTTAPILISNQYYRIQLNGLGCEACANRIKNTLNKVEWIENTRVYFDNQTAIIQVNNMEKKSIENTIVKMIQDIDVKYSAQVLDSWVGYTK